MTFYEAGQQHALETLGIKVADANPLLVRQRKDPFTEIHRKVNRALNIKMPKFDMGALLKRQINNPLRQPRLHLSGKTPALKM